MKKLEQVLKDYLDKLAAQDPQFAIKYANEKKSIHECARYIIGEASAQAVEGVAGMTDEEMYGMAVHYYDEEKIEIRSISGGAKISRESVVSKESAKIELTEEEKERARKMAMERAIEEQRKKMTERKAKAKKDETPQPEQMSLF